MNFSFSHTLYNFCKDSELILDGMVLRIQKLFPENKPQTGSYLLSVEKFEKIGVQIPSIKYHLCKSIYQIPFAVKIFFNESINESINQSISRTAYLPLKSRK